MVNRKLMIVVICIFTIIGLYPVNHAVFAQTTTTTSTETSQCRALDLVLLIDQSGSMNKATDTGNFRVDAGKDIIRRLATNALLECPQAIHRLAIGNYGSDFEWVNFAPAGQPPVYWVKIGNYNENTDRTTWEKDKLNPLTEPVKQVNMGDTDIQTAIQRGASLLSEMPAEGSISRSKVVILLTDGLPYPTPKGLDPYMTAIRNALRDGYPQTGSVKDISFWMVALNDPNYDYMSVKTTVDNQRVTMEEFWKGQAQAHGGDLVKLSQNQSQIPDTLNKIYETEIGNEGISVPCEVPFYIDSYTQQAVFTFSKNRPDIGVRLKYFGDENQLPFSLINGQKVGEDGTIQENYAETNGKATEAVPRPLIQYWSDIDYVERYTLDRPPAGKWMVQSLNCPDIRARYTTRVATADLSQPKGTLPVVPEAPNYDMSFPSFFEVTVLERNGEPFVDESSYPLSVNLTYQDPQGRTISAPDGSENWVLESRGGGIWMSKDPVQVPVPGKYLVHFWGAIRPADPNQRQDKIVFDQTVQPFEVLNVGRFNFLLDSPENGKPLPHNSFIDGKKTYLSIPIKAKLVKSAGSSTEQIPSDGVLFGDRLLVASLVTSDGQVLHSYPLSEENGAFSGEIPSEDVGKLSPNKDYILRVDFVGEFDQQKWLPIRNSVESTFQLTPRDSFSTEQIEPSSKVRVHPNLISAHPLLEKIVPVTVILRLNSALESSQIDPGKVLKSGKTVSDLITGELITPATEGEKTEAIPLSFGLADDSDGTGKVLRVTAAGDLNKPGEYQIKLKLNTEALNDDFISPTIQKTITFERKDSFPSQPWFAILLSAILLGIILGLLGWIVWGLTGGPGGKLIFIPSLPGADTPRQIKLPKTRWFSARKNKDLETFGIGAIIAKKPSRKEISGTYFDDSDDGDNKKKKIRAVHIFIKDKEKEDLYDGILIPGQEYPYTESINLAYQ